MIVNKNNISTFSEKVDNPVLPDDDNTTIETVENNPIEDVYLAVKRILESLHVDPNDDASPKLFQTVKMDNGQFERIVSNTSNTEYGIAFPAAFIRLTNVRFLVAQQRIGEGRADLKIRFVLNDLNNSDDTVETHGFRVFQQINDAIQDGKDTEAALNERCNLTYFDMLESLDNGLQPYWITYEIWFRTSSSFQYRNWVERYVVMPPFTNHSDAPEHDTDNHGDHDDVTMDMASGFAPYVDDDESDDSEEDEE